jgi:hypothetical protein
MTPREPVETTNLDRYGFPPLPWSRAIDSVMAQVATPEITWFLGTIRPDGTPHAAGIGAAWYEGDLYFTSNAHAQKARNVAEHPAATLSVRLKGIDLVFEGHAARTTDPATLAAVAKIYNDGGWPATVEGDAFTAPFNAPSAGPPPWQLYRFTFEKVIGVATAEPYGATRWRFSG